MSAVLQLDSMRRRRTRRLGDLFDAFGAGSFDPSAGLFDTGFDFSMEPALPPDSAGISDNPIELPDDIGAGTVSVEQLRRENASGAFNDLQTPQPYFGQNTAQYNDPYGNPIVLGYGPGGSPFTAYLPSLDGGGRGGSAVVLRTGLVAPSAASSPLKNLFSQPIYSGSTISWGWALIGGGLLLWLLLRK